ncbi:uncharacterized protein BJ212DRAFT_1567005 [Suillus subaureus]|uniref:Uncharacterized protein n=1 Tax=Suillus subaureus TaxID=48587 RepID=A0A9P7EHV6_9AGAM|nr:uncharacterized protein BJ212DRAFT_1567005 [Suillus subaureus]KAG1821537.1 hypothetical protein BJ212DRAFT_1567005 [Suillus subaureus]
MVSAKDFRDRLRQGADGTWGDDTSKLKSLVADWVNRELKPNPPIDPNDKNCRGFINDACGRLLCPTKLDWSNPIVRAGIRDRVDGYVVMEMSWPAFLYEKYTANQDNLEEGLFKSSLLVQKVKMHIAQIIKMHKVTPRSIAYVSCQLRFALSSVTSWRSIDGDFDYTPFWHSIVDFFERPPGHTAW